MNTKKKSLIAIAAMSLALLGFASSASAAADGVVRDVPGNTIIPINTELHFVGWTRFGNGFGGITCHVTAITKATTADGTTGQLTNFSIPDKTQCTGDGFYAGCTVSAATVTNLPYHLTATPTDFDVTGTWAIHYSLSACFESSSLSTASAITLKPLKTGIRVVTNTSNFLGVTAASGEPIAGVELSGSGTATGTGSISFTGELELTSPARCTYKLVSS